MQSPPQTPPWNSSTHPFSKFLLDTVCILANCQLIKIPIYTIAIFAMNGEITSVTIFLGLLVF